MPCVWPWTGLIWLTSFARVGIINEDGNKILLRPKINTQLLSLPQFFNKAQYIIGICFSVCKREHIMCICYIITWANLVKHSVRNHECTASRIKPTDFTRLEESYVVQLSVAFAVHDPLKQSRLYLLFQLTFQYNRKWIIIWLRNISLNLGHFWNHTKVYNYHYIVTC